MSDLDTTAGYTGRDNLEVMQEAENYNQWLCSLVSSRASKTDHVLDFGAGSGTFAKIFAKEGFNVSCVEPDGILRSGLITSGLSTVESAEQLPPQSFDFIYTFNVLEHIENDAAEAAKLVRALKPGGTLLVYVPAFQILFSSMDRKVGHYRRYRLSPLVKMIEASGLRVTYARYADCLGYCASLAYRLFGADDGSLSPTSIKVYDRMIFPISRLFDVFAGYAIGKNALVVAKKP